MKLICRPCTWWAANLHPSDDQRNNEEALRMPLSLGSTYHNDDHSDGLILQTGNPEQQHLVGTSSSNKRRASTYIGNIMTIKVFRHLLRRVLHLSLHETHSFIVHDAPTSPFTPFAMDHRNDEEPTIVHLNVAKFSHTFQTTLYSNHSFVKPNQTQHCDVQSPPRGVVASGHKQDNTPLHAQSLTGQRRSDGHGQPRLSRDPD